MTQTLAAAELAASGAARFVPKFFRINDLEKLDILLTNADTMVGFKP